MKILISILLVIITLSLTVTGFSHDGIDHNGNKQEMLHGSMKLDMDKNLIMLPEQTVNGVTATVHLKDVKSTMAKVGKKYTHHIMLSFKGANNGKMINAKVAALKIIDSSGKELKLMELMVMEGHAGADIILATPGAYTLKIAVNLSNGKKEQYEFKISLK